MHARVGSLTEVRGISRRNRLFTFLTTDKDVDQNTLWVNRDSNNLGSIAVQMNLVPVDAFAGSACRPPTSRSRRPGST